MEDKNNYIKRFDDWNHKKKQLESRILDESFFFLNREVWWTATGVNIGKEMDGKNDNFERPVLILKKFDEDNFLGLPISTHIGDDNLYHTLTFNYEKTYT